MLPRWTRIAARAVSGSPASTAAAMFSCSRRDPLDVRGVGQGVGVAEPGARQHDHHRAERVDAGRGRSGCRWPRPRPGGTRSRPRPPPRAPAADEGVQRRRDRRRPPRASARAAASAAASLSTPMPEVDHGQDVVVAADRRRLDAERSSARAGPARTSRGPGRSRRGPRPAAGSPPRGPRCARRRTPRSARPRTGASTPGASVAGEDARP